MVSPSNLGGEKAGLAEVLTQGSLRSQEMDGEDPAMQYVGGPALCAGPPPNGVESLCAFGDPCVKNLRELRSLRSRVTTPKDVDRIAGMSRLSGPSATRWVRLPAHRVLKSRVVNRR